MKLNFLIGILFFINGYLIAQTKIPELIEKDLTLSPQVKAYVTTGFIVNKDVTLTILPGTKITTSSGKDKYCHINIKGTIIIGDKGPAKSKPVIFEGYSPWFKFEGAIIEINSLQITTVNIQFQGDNSGTICNSSFYRDQLAIPYPFIVAVPTKGNLTITDCLIEDQGIEIKPKNFPDDIGNLTISKTAFTYTPRQNKDTYFYKKCSLNIYAFAHATKCDTYADITFTPFDWKIVNSISTEWYIENAELRKSVENSAKPVQNFAIKLDSKPITSFKQTPEPPKQKVKEEKK